MSWSVFKATLLPAMQSQAFGNNMAGFAKSFALAYDTAIKAGKETVSPIPLMKGNVTAMEAQIVGLLSQTQQSNSLTLLDVIGPAVITYWTGCNKKYSTYARFGFKSRSLDTYSRSTKQ